MKYKYILAFLCVMGLSTTSCKKFLETEPTDFYSPANYYETPEQLQVALNGIYSSMMVERSYAQVTHFNFVSATDEMIPSRDPSSDLRGLAYNYDANHGYVSTAWQYPYISINNANLLIDNINKPTMNEKERGYIKGQALFLRAFNYFLLTTQFGEVPLVLHLPGITDVNIPASSQTEIYTQIVADLKEAEVLLQGRTAASLGYNDQVTISAVQAMLARVYLYWAGYPLNDASKYNDVITYCDKVIGSGMHNLNPDYKQVFINLCQDLYDVKENILEWGSAGAPNGATNKGGNDIGNFVGINSGILLINGVYDGVSFGGAGWVSPTKKLFDSYEVDPTSTLVNKASLDTRRDWNCADYIWTVNTTTGIRYKNEKPNPWQMMCGKFNREYCPPAIKNSGTYNINWPVIRYSDVLLMKAEAENQVNGPNAAAYDAINKVRQRAYGTMYGNIVKNIIVTNGGSGYVTATPPIVTISGGGGAGATGVAIVSAGGVVTGVRLSSRGTLTTSGQYFSSTPTVTIAPPTTGTQATATATITNGSEYILTPGLGKAAFQQAVRDERMRELCFEAYRKYDLIRWGNFVNDIKDYTQTALTDGIVAGNNNGYRSLQNIAPRFVLMPKPTYELNLNKALKQNVGY